MVSAVFCKTAPMKDSSLLLKRSCQIPPHVVAETQELEEDELRGVQPPKGHVEVTLCHVRWSPLAMTVDWVDWGPFATAWCQVLQLLGLPDTYGDNYEALADLPHWPAT